MRGRKGTQWSNLCACGGGVSRAAILSSVLFTSMFRILGCLSIPPNLAVGARGTTRSRQRPPIRTPRFVPTPPRRHRPPNAQAPR
eukprot:scaffold16632_cov68-Phaeocystis_antarctica.AAC.2